MILPTIFENTSDLKELIRNAPIRVLAGIQFARQILADIERRFAHYTDRTTLRIATLIDPRYKDILEDDTTFLLLINF